MLNKTFKKFYSWVYFIAWYLKNCQIIPTDEFLINLKGVKLKSKNNKMNFGRDILLHFKHPLLMMDLKEINYFSKLHYENLQIKKLTCCISVSSNSETFNPSGQNLKPESPPNWSDSLGPSLSRINNGNC